MEITFKENKYTIKYTLRAFFIYEQITGQVFKMRTLTDEYLFLYCLILANAPDINMSFEDFVSECDDRPDWMISMQKFVHKEMEKQSLLLQESSVEDSKKKN